MARYVDVATIHFNIEASCGSPGAQESALSQFQRAAKLLDGTGVNLVVTCEGMEAIAQTMQQGESAKKPGPVLTAYSDFAQRNRCCVAGSVKIEEAGKVYNALAFLGPDGAVLGDYRKTFLTQGEYDLGLTPGSGARVVETPAGRLGGAICFDLNFEELRLQYRPLKPDLIAFSSMYHGGHVQQAWAYENRCFFAAACKDCMSEIRDPLGSCLSSASYYAHVARARLNLDRVTIHMDRNMDRFPDLRRRYGADVRVDIASDLGVAVLYSESPKRTALDLVKEFELTPLDEYLERSRISLRSQSAPEEQQRPRPEQPPGKAR